MTPEPPRPSAFPRWSLSAALLRVSITLGLLAALIAAFTASLVRLDPAQLSAQSAVVERALGPARRLDLTIAPNTAHQLRLSGGSDFSARLSASRSGDLKLTPQAASAGEQRWTLSRTVRAVPVLIQLDAQNGLPGTLDLRVPTTTPLSLTLTHAADDSVLDLRSLNLERLTYLSGSGTLRATLPVSGQPQLDLTSGGDLDLTLPPGTAHITLAAKGDGSRVSLSLPASARVVLDIEDGAGPLTRLQLPLSLQARAQDSRAGGRTRRYVQAGRPGGPQLTAHFKLSHGSLTVKGETP